MIRLVAVALCLSTLGVAQGDPGRWVLRYDAPAGQWVEALPVGNGRMGAMVFGGPTKARYQFNEDNLWTGGPHSYAHEGAAEHLDEIRRLLFAGERRAAEELATREFMSTPIRQQFYQPMGDLRIKQDRVAESQVAAYQRSLDLTTATATTTFVAEGVRYTRRVIASFPDRAIVVRLEADQPGALAFAASLSSPQERSQSEATDQRTLLLTGLVNDAEIAPDVLAEGQVRFAASVRVSETDGEVRQVGDTLRVEKASSATLILTAATNVIDYQDLSADPVARCEDDLTAAADKPFAQLLADHVADHRRLFDRVSFELSEPASETATAATDDRLLASKRDDDTDLAALVFHYGRYLMIASSRAGGQPANLQGLWNQDLKPAWGSKYTTNINAEMNYWLTEPCGLEECNAPLFDAIAELAETGAEVARAHYDAAGWVLHHNYDRWRGAAPINAANHGIWPTGGAWLCQHLWMHYAYTEDEDFLREKAYPLMKGAAEFFVDYLVEDPRGDKRWLVSGPSNSPEQGGLVMGPTMDHQIIRNLLANTAAAAEVLGVDEEFRTRLQLISERIAPNQIGRLGQLQEWLEDVDDPDNRHRHVSHLWGLHPGREITPDTPELLVAARKSLEMRGDGGTGWSRAWKVNFWARLRDGDRALSVLEGLMTLTGSTKDSYNGGGLYPNLFDAHPPFQIDGNFGATAGIVEMLLQSHRQTDKGVRRIELLPALPEAWPEGSVTGLRTRGGFEVDVQWRDGELVECRLTSRLGNPAIVSIGDRSTPVALAAGESVTLDHQLRPI